MPIAALRSRVRLLPGAALALAVAGTAGWIGFKSFESRAPVAQECSPAKPVAERLAPLARGGIAALAVAETPAVPPAISFRGPDGGESSLAAFAGKTVLLNLWATWCLPCRQEMPALDKLQASLGGPDFEVVAVNVDTRDPGKARAWLAQNGIRNLAYYAEPEGKLLQVLQRSGHLVGLPTTLLIDRSGCEIAVLKGPAEWATPEATALIRTALER
jgi:thiol-disulfide isomerase/thioredoxin